LLLLLLLLHALISVPLLFPLLNPLYFLLSLGGGEGKGKTIGHLSGFTADHDNGRMEE